MNSGAIVISKVWRSELASLCLFVPLAAASVYLSHKFPVTIVAGDLFRFGSKTIFLHLPVLALIPCFVIMNAVYRIYNVRYAVDSRFIEVRTGVLSFKQVITRIRYEDIRSIETDQTLIGRLLDVGNLLIGTAATGGVEIVMNGVGAPKEVQEMIQNERDKRVELQRRSGELKESASA